MSGRPSHGKPCAQPMSQLRNWSAHSSDRRKVAVSSPAAAPTTMLTSARISTLPGSWSLSRDDFGSGVMCALPAGVRSNRGGLRRRRRFLRRGLERRQQFRTLVSKHHHITMAHAAEAVDVHGRLASAMVCCHVGPVAGRIGIATDRSLTEGLLLASNSNPTVKLTQPRELQQRFSLKGRRRHPRRRGLSPAHHRRPAAAGATSACAAHANSFSRADAVIATTAGCLSFLSTEMA